MEHPGAVRGSQPRVVRVRLESGWPRYAFGGLAISSLFVARFAVNLWDTAVPPGGDGGQAASRFYGPFRFALLAWLAVIVVPGLSETIKPIARPPRNAAAEMAAYLTANVPTSELVETWEPELGALTRHNYHYPPARLLNVAVRHIWLGGPAPNAQYHFLESGSASRPRGRGVREVGAHVSGGDAGQGVSSVTKVGPYQAVPVGTT